MPATQLFHAGCQSFYPGAKRRQRDSATSFRHDSYNLLEGTVQNFPSTCFEVSIAAEVSLAQEERVMQSIAYHFNNKIHLHLVASALR